MRLRLIDNPHELYGFLVTWDYPAVWNVESLRRFSLMCRIEDPQETGVNLVGYVWAHWFGDNGALEFHVCIHPDYRGKWLTDDLWKSMYHTAQIVGAKSLRTRPIGDKADRGIFLLLRRRFHFTRASDGSIVKSIPENIDGNFLTSQSNAASAYAGSRGTEDG